MAPTRWAVVMREVMTPSGSIHGPQRTIVLDPRQCTVPNSAVLVEGGHVVCEESLRFAGL